jgi:hypothetical protein
MSNSTFCIAILFCLSYSICAFVNGLSIVELSKNCKRHVTNISSAKEINFISVSRCKNYESSSKTVKGINFKIRSPLTSNTIPTFIIRGFESSNIESETDINSVLFAKLGFTKVIEYNETNNKTGFQQDDNVIEEVDLRKLKFTSISKTLQQKNNTNIYYLQYQANSNKLFNTIKFGVTISTDEVYAKYNPIGKTKTIISPNSMKLDILINGIKYNNSDTNIAIASLIVTRQNIIRRDNSTKLYEERPDESSNDQDVLEINDNNSKGALSFKNYVSNNISTTAKINNITLSSSILLSDSYDNIFDGGASTIGNNKVITQLYFSVAGQEKIIFWDPSLIQSSYSSSNSSPSNSSSPLNSSSSKFTQSNIISFFNLNIFLILFTFIFYLF